MILISGWKGVTSGSSPLSALSRLMKRHAIPYRSSGDLNTGGNLSESSFLEALFGLEFGHADVADDADFFAAYLSPIMIYW